MNTLNSQTARQLIDAAEHKAQQMDISVSIAVVDSGAHLLEFRRMDGAILGSADVAQRKARTCALFPMPTGDFGQLIREAQLTGIELSNGLLTGFPGGIPLKADQSVIGGLGISGGSAEQDLEIATYALDKVDLL